MARQHREENRPVPQVNNRQDKNNTSSGYTIVLLCGLTERKETACSGADTTSKECSSRSMYVSLLRCRYNTSVNVNRRRGMVAHTMHSLRQPDEMGFKFQSFSVHILMSAFLGAFAELLQWLLAPSCLFVCLFVWPSAWNNSAPTGRIFIKFCIWVFFENLPSKYNFH